MTGLAVDENAGRDRQGELDEFLAATPDDPILRRARGLDRLRSGDAGRRPGRPGGVGGGSRTTPSAGRPWPKARSSSATSTASRPPSAPSPRPTRRPRPVVGRRGRLEEARGRPDPAIDAYRKALEPGPDDRKALYRLGQILAAGDGPRKGRPLLAKAEEVRLRDLSIVLEMDRCLRGGVDPGLFETIARPLPPGRPRPSRPEAGSTRPSASTRPDPRPRRAGDLRRARRAGRRLPSRASPAGATVARAGPDDPLGRPLARFEDVAGRWGLAFRVQRLALGQPLPGRHDGRGRRPDRLRRGRPARRLLRRRLPAADRPGDDPRPNKLFRNRGDGSFEDVTDRAGVGGHGYGMGCAVADYDGDGHDDLYVTGLGRSDPLSEPGGRDVRGRHRAGQGRLGPVVNGGRVRRPRRRRRPRPGGRDLRRGRPEAASPSASTRPAGRSTAPPASSGPSSTTSSATTATARSPTSAERPAWKSPAGCGLGLAIADLDEDGRLDLFVANDAAPNFFFRNLGRPQIRGGRARPRASPTTRRPGHGEHGRHRRGLRPRRPDRHLPRQLPQRGEHAGQEPRRRPLRRRRRSPPGSTRPAGPRPGSAR